MVTGLQPIKKTKSVIMEGDKDGVNITIEPFGNTIWVPVKSVFQVRRGLESYIQRFYRRRKR